MVVKKRRINLLGEIFAWQFAHGHFFRMAMALVGLIALVEPERDPADFIFNRHDLEPRIPFQDTRKDHIEKRVFDFSRLLHADTVTIDAVAGLTIHTRAEAGENM